MNWRFALWLTLLVAASVEFSFVFACAVPFAALGALAAVTLGRRDALLLVGAAWLANQAVGFGYQGYPWTAECLLWGAIFGIVAVAVTLAARQVYARMSRHGAPLAYAASFAGAFIVYEAGLFLIAATMLGGTEAYAPTGVLRIFAINAAAFIGLLLLNRFGMAIGLARKPALRPMAA
jgi:hypothetical protein